MPRIRKAGSGDAIQEMGAFLIIRRKQRKDGAGIAEGPGTGILSLETPGTHLGAAVLAAIALMLLVLAVFLPILDFEFVKFDVYGQLIQNPTIRGLTLHNLKQIFTSRCITSYYPVRALSLAVDYQIWGMDPWGFKLTQILIHLANTLLVFGLASRLLRRSGKTQVQVVPFWSEWAAFLPAGVFAVHPVMVEPVTWVAGREELLMTLGALGCIHFHLTARQTEEKRDKPLLAGFWHVLATLSCLIACWSNAVAAVIPLLITTWDLLDVPPPRFRQILRNTSVLWLIGAATIAVKILGPAAQLPFQPSGRLPGDRWKLVADLYRLNLKTIVWPTDLAIVYGETGPYRPGSLHVVVGGVLIGLSCLLLWKLRNQRVPLFGLAWFFIALAPSSQIMAHHWIRADRFLYLPMVGLAVAGACGMKSCAHAFRSRTAKVGFIVAALLAICLLARRSVAQVDTWQDSLSVWEHCVQVSPQSPIAQGEFADVLTDRGQFARAIPHYRMALRLAPDDMATLNNFAVELAGNAQTALRDYDLAIELAERGCNVTKWENWRLRRTLAIACNNYAVAMEHAGNFRRAIELYSRASQADPAYVAPWFNLALLMAVCPDQALRRPDEAVRLAEHACQIAGNPDANGWAILAAAYREAGQLDKAAAALENTRHGP